MGISPHLRRKLKEQLGTDAGDDLAGQLERMDAIKAEVAELRHDMQRGFATMEARFQQMDSRFQVMDAKMEAVLQKGLKEQTRFFFVAWSVLLAAIVGLYSR
jgi:hypothetical protein